MLDWLNKIAEMQNGEFEIFIAVRLLILIFAICIIVEITKLIFKLIFRNRK
jgi:uncharacterized membrane protein